MHKETPRKIKSSKAALANKLKLNMRTPRSIRLWYYRVGRARDSRFALGLVTSIECRVVHLFVAWIMIIFRRQICIFPPATPRQPPGTFTDGACWPLNGHQTRLTPRPALKSMSLAMGLPYFYAIFAHVCRACKSVEIFMFRELAHQQQQLDVVVVHWTLLKKGLKVVKRGQRTATPTPRVLLNEMARLALIHKCAQVQLSWIPQYASYE